MKALNKFVLVALLATAASGVSADPRLRESAAQFFGTVTEATPAERNAPQAQLGRALFWDARISGNGQVSCASCHAAESGGSDSRVKSIDARGKPMPRQSQTVFNAMHQPQLRWLGDRPDPAKMAEGLATGPLGFASQADVLAALEKAGYRERFRTAFSGETDPLSMTNYGRAIAAYQRTLNTPSAFDRYLAGDERALTPKQEAGLRRFIDTGCVGCHSGPLLGGMTFQRFGMTRDYATVTGSNPVDPGRYAITSKEEDRNVFRVPMLRNIAQTAPYFHDGSVATLPEAVRVMADLQLGRKMNSTEANEIAAFLESLTGAIPLNFSIPRD